MPSLPPLNALRAFEATARHLSFTKAAEELNVTRAAVSQQVKQLEHFLDARLVERKGSQLSLTQHALRYLPVLTNSFQSVSASTEQLFLKKQRAELHVRVAQSFCHQWLIPRLADFRRQFPDLAIKLTTTSDPLPDDSRCADIEILNGYPGSYASYTARRLTHERWVIVASPGYLKLNPIRTMHELLTADKLAISGYQENWAQLFSQYGLAKRRLTMSIQFDHTLLAVEAAVNHLGVLMVRDVLVQEALRQGALCRVGEYGLVTEGGHYLIVRHQSPISDHFCHWLTQALQ